MSNVFIFLLFVLTYEVFVGEIPIHTVAALMTFRASTVKAQNLNPNIGFHRLIDFY